MDRSRGGPIVRSSRPHLRLLHLEGCRAIHHHDDLATRPSRASRDVVGHLQGSRCLGSVCASARAAGSDHVRRVVGGVSGGRRAVRSRPCCDRRRPGVHPGDRPAGRWRRRQDYGTSPLVMGRGIEIHPALVIFGVLAGGEIGGVAGMFLSVPVIAAARIVWRRLQAPRSLRWTTGDSNSRSATPRR